MIDDGTGKIAITKIAITKVDTPAERYRQEVQQHVREMVLLADVNGWLFTPVILLPEDFKEADMRRAQDLLNEQGIAGIWQEVRTTDEMRAWATQHLPSTWRVDFVPWRGDETQWPVCS